MSEDRTPYFRLDDDGRHVLWYHWCNHDGIQGDWSVLSRLPAGTPEEATLPNGRWGIVSTDPLTVTPSILCGLCGCHGFIRDGQWVPA